MRQLILSICTSLVALTGMPSHAGDLAKQLNGTWQYVAAIEADHISTYEGSSAVQLVILDNTWGIFSKGTLIPGSVQRVEYNEQSSPASFVRSKGKAPHATGHGIFKVDGEHLIYTTTPLDATGFGSTSGAIGDYEPASRDCKADAKALFGDSGLAFGRSATDVPKSFSPEGTTNTQYILKRISNSTSAMRQITSR